MRATAENDSANDPGDAYLDSSSADVVLSGISEQLRGAYREVTGGDQPEHLVGLARKLDALISGSGEDR